MYRSITLVFTFFLFFSISLIAQSDQDFYEPSSIRQIEISFEQENWMELLDSMRIYSNDQLIGNVVLDGSQYENVGIRWQASKAFRVGLKRNAMHIELDYIDKDQNHLGVKTLKLSTALRDPSMVREVLGYQIARKYMPAPGANYAQVKINRKAYGLFVNLEAVDDGFLEKQFGSSENAFFKCTPKDKKKAVNIKDCKKNLHASLEYEEKASCYTNNFQIRSSDGWDDLIELTDVLNNSSDNIEDVLNVDRTLWMLAFNNVLVNLDSYSGFMSQNYYLYKDDQGRFNPVLGDLNFAFGSYKRVGSQSDLNLKQLQKLDPLLHADNNTKPLIKELLSNPVYKKMYLNHIRTIVYDNFESKWYEKEAQALQTVINAALMADQNKQYSAEEFGKSLSSTIGKRSKIPGIVELMSKRSKFLKKHSEVSVFPPEISEVKVLGREKFSNVLVEDFTINAKVEKRAKRVVVFYRFNSDDAYEHAFMSDDGNSKDGEMADKVFGVTIKAPADAGSIEYYILAENVGAVAFSPKDYMFAPFKAELEELNK